MNQNINLFSFQGKNRILHLSWFAFFLSFMVWFNHAPLMESIRDTFLLTDQQVKVLLILNIAITIPARIIIGMLVDQFGPKRVFSSLLLISSFICFAFAFSNSFEQLALLRFLLGMVGAGFVIGIRMISEWFPAKEVGIAEGIYGGWGNFGSAAAALTLPTLALWYGGEETGWRYAIATTGAMIFIYAFIYFFSVSDTPKGSTYFKPKKAGAMEVSSIGDLFFYLLVNIPLYLALATLSWKLSLLQLFSSTQALIVYCVLFLLFCYQASHVIRVNKGLFTQAPPEYDRYKFKQVAILNFSYFVSFGSELAVVSMLPLFFIDTFGISQLQAGLLASGFAFMNIVSRPIGGLVSDRFSRKISLITLMLGLMVGYAVMSQIDAQWPIYLAVAACMFCSFFVQAAEGAVFAVVPLIKRRLTGQIAGMTGAYGNVGGVTFLTVYSFVSAQEFFIVIAATTLFGIMALLFLDEPKGTMAEVLPDGTVQMIDVH